MFLVIRIRLSSCFKWCWPFYKYFWTINYATGLWVMFLKCNWECFVNCFLVRPPNTSRAYITSNHLWKVLDTDEGETPNLYAKSSVWMFSLSFISTSSNSSIRLSLVGLCTNGCRKLKRTVKMWYVATQVSGMGLSSRDDIGPLHAMSLGHGIVLFARCCPLEVKLHNVPHPFGISLYELQQSKTFPWSAQLNSCTNMEWKVRSSHRSDFSMRVFGAQRRLAGITNSSDLPLTR